VREAPSARELDFAKQKTEGVRVQRRNISIYPNYADSFHRTRVILTLGKLALKSHCGPPPSRREANRSEPAYGYLITIVWPTDQAKTHLCDVSRFWFKAVSENEIGYLNETAPFLSVVRY